MHKLLNIHAGLWRDVLFLYLKMKYFVFIYNHSLSKSRVKEGASEVDHAILPAFEFSKMFSK